MNTVFRLELRLVFSWFNWKGIQLLLLFSQILQKAEISCTYIYSSLDPTARKISIAKFQNRKVSVMVVTDLAARGIDIPLLDNVINYHFPAKAKLFVHRVGKLGCSGFFKS